MVSRFQAARRHAMIMGAMNEDAMDAEVERKRELERKREAARSSRLARINEARNNRRKIVAIDTEPKVWSDSRLGRCMKEHSKSDDWLSKVLFKNMLAAIIQAHWRGYVLRKKWQNDKAQVIEEAKNATVPTPASNSSYKPGSTSKLPGATSRPTGRRQMTKQKPGSTAKEEHTGSEAPEEHSDESDWSDLELESFDAWKFKAKLPPWAGPEKSKLLGVYALLAVQHRNIDILRDPSESQERVEQVRARRVMRQTTSSNTTRHEETDPAETPLPIDLVNELLLDRYIEKYRRLGLLKRTPKFRRTSESVEEE